MQQVTSTLSETFYHVLTSSFTHALEYLQRSFVEEFTTHTTAFDHVPYAGELAAVCTEHAANLVCEQLELVLFEQQKHVNMEDQESSKSYMSSCWSQCQQNACDHSRSAQTCICEDPA